MDIADKVLRARMRLMLLHPHLSSCVARLPMVEVARDSWCTTAATDGFSIYWNPAFFAGLDEEKVMGVLAHELLHVVLAHIDRRGTRDEELWNISIDHAVNLYLIDQGFDLPANRLADQRFRNRTAEDIYAQLKANPSLLMPQTKPVARQPTVQKKNLIRIGKKKGIPDETDNPSQTETGKGSDVRSPGGFDIHVKPTDPRVSANQRERPSGEDLRRLIRELQMDMYREVGRGNLPAEFTEAFKHSSASKVPWQALLARCFNGIRRDDYRYLPPSKKHLWRGIYLPSIGVPGPQTIVCAIDTSGSIQGQIAEQFLAEVSKLRMSAKCKLYIVQCDAAIQKVEAYESWETPGALSGNTKLLGRGGTDFRPVFGWVKREVIPADGVPDFIVYLTDGYGTFPENWAICPTIWVAPDEARKEFPFGSVIRMDGAG